MEALHFHFDIDGEDFSSAGDASVVVKKKLRQLGFPSDVIRRCSIAMYEGEINMVIHANGGVADVDVYPDKIVIVLEDHGPGIPDVELAMQEGYSTSTEQIRNMGFGAGMGLPPRSHSRNRPWRAPGSPGGSRKSLRQRPAKGLG